MGQGLARHAEEALSSEARFCGVEVLESGLLSGGTEIYCYSVRWSLVAG